MATNKLKGLPGLNRISDKERTYFILSNEAKLRQYEDDPEAYEEAAEVLYNNLLFKKHFGDAGVAFAKANNVGYEQRVDMLRDDVAQKAFAARFSPWNSNGTQRNNHKGLGANYEKYFGHIDSATGKRIGGISSEGLIKVLESGYMSPDEFDADWKEKEGAALRADNRLAPFIPAGSAVSHPISSVAYGESARKMAQEKNERLLEHIYNDEADNGAKGLSEIVAQTYTQADPKIFGRNDKETVSLFIKAITPDYANGNMGIPEYASHYGIVEGNGISKEMWGFSIDDMREVLAKKAVYDTYLGPEMAQTALNNEAKRYIHDHQDFGTKAALFSKDVLISAASYTADKANGFYNLGLMAADTFNDKPVVWVDTANNIIDPNHIKLFRDRQGQVFYNDDKGNRVNVHQEQVDRTTLHNMGKNFDGSEDESWLNPQDWTRREQFGVWDKDLAKQYEKIGSSPYKVVYNPNDDRDLLYESFKMMSFGLADAGLQLIPFGIGAAGKALSTAGKLGKFAQNIGRVTNTASKFLTAETRLGQGFQATAGALGIAYAYNRGAFQETLAQNMANLEQAVQDRSRDEVWKQYQNDAQYKAAVDKLVDARAVTMKAEKLAQMGERAQIIDEEKFNKIIRQDAQREVLTEMANQKVKEYKVSDDYAVMQEKAVNSAGQTAVNSFWPEAIKYSLVNTFGHRRFLYSNPTSITQKAAQTFNRLKEITTSTGRKRLAVDVGKSLISGDKWKNFGKFAGKQAWGGAWTNGTDDMMVDAAERINEDSFGRYLHQYENGEALADTYGFADGLYSYWMGLQNSLGQESTRDAAIVGAGGSLVSGNLHFTNIASLATKSGREAFKQAFKQQYERDEQGLIKKDEQGNPIVKELSWRDNWRDRLGFFIQNGVLNEYYGAKQEGRDLQRHADFVNELLDQYDDFNIIKDLVASDIGRDNAINIGDEKTMRFVQAFNAINALNHLGSSEKDPETLSSIVQDRKTLIERAAKLGAEEDHDFTDEELQNLVGQYYSNNAIPQTEQNTEMALQYIGENARKLQEANEAYNKAEDQIQAIEKETGTPILPSVRFRMKLSQALDNHWRDRIKTMKDEIGDSSERADAPTGEELIATFGGKKKADSQLKYYEAHEAFVLSQAAQATDELQEKLETYKKAQESYRDAQDGETMLRAQEDLKKAKDAYEEAVESKMYQEDLLSAVQEKKSNLQEALNSWEKGTKSRVLSADEIMHLDPVTRARMMLPENRHFYNTKQQKQIDRLEKNLKMRHTEGDPLQKIQDIALLTQRIAQNEDAYHRLSRNPDAAALQLEKQRQQEAEKAVSQINERNAQTLSNYIIAMTDALKGRRGVSQEAVDDYVYKTLRVYNPTLLRLIDEQSLLPNHPQQIKDARAWGEILSDLNAVIDNMDENAEWKDNVRNTIDAVLGNTNSRDEIVKALDDAIEKGHIQADALTKVLLGLDQQKYQKEAAIIENRKQKNERLTAQRQQQEEARKKAEETAKAAAVEAAKRGAEDAEMRATEEEKQKLVDEGDTIPIDFGETPAGTGDGDNASAGNTAGTTASAEHKDGDVVSDVSEKGGVKITKYTQFRATKNGVKPVTSKGGLKIDASVISKESLENAGQYDEIRLSELRESNGKMTGTVWAKDSGGWIQFDVKFDKDPRIEEAAVVQQPTEQKITTIVTSKKGNTATGTYSVNTDDAGFIHIKHDIGSSALTQRKVKSSDMKDIGISEEDVLGKREDYDTPENYDVFKEIYEDEGFRIKNVTIRPDGTVAVSHNEDYFELQGEKAQKFLDKVFPELRAGMASQAKEEGATEPINVLVGWAEGRISEEDAIKQLDGTEYVKHTKGNPGLGTKDGVHLSNKVEWELGKYITEKYPFLTYGNISVATGVSTFGGNMNLTVVKDAEGNEYGTPSNFLRSLATRPDGRAAEAVKKGLETMQQNQDSSVNNNMAEDHDDTIGDYVHGQSATLAEEIQDAGESATIGNETVDVDTVNDSIEKNNESSVVSITANAMAEYQTDALKEHRLVHKEGKEPNDKMNRFYAWMQNAGIKLQNIIDDELPQILEKNPHTKIKFACVRPEHNVTNDYDMVTHLLLVTDYDPTIQSVHKEENGGVIESEGKKYLIVGIGGYGSSNNKDRRNLYNIIYGGGSKVGILQQVKMPFFREHPSERFKVLEGVSTEVVPGSLTPGWIIQQNETDNARRSRKISELLADKEHNPHGLTMDTLSWSIIEHSQNLDIMKTSGKEVMHPQNRETNAGRVFVLIPAGNGKLLAAKIDALYYNDSKFNKESALYQEIQQLLMQLTAPRYEDRYDALLKLMQILYITPEGHDILLSKDANGITLVRNGQKVHTVFTQAPNFTTQDFFDAIADWNPRINITAKVLQSPKLLKKYDEAGALMTDLAKLGTVGTNYEVYGINVDGSMLKPTNVDWAPNRTDSNGEYVDSHRLDVPYLHGTYYQYNIDSGTYTLNGVEVTDKDTIKGLDYARRIIGLVPIKTERVWDYYILNEGEHTEVIRQSNKTKKIEEVIDDDAQKIVETIKEQQEAAVRKAAIEKVLNGQDSTERETINTLDTFDQSMEDSAINMKTGDLTIFGTPHVSEDSESKPSIMQGTKSASVQSDIKTTTKSFMQTIRGENRNIIIDALKQKWSEAPLNSLRQLEHFLKEKGLQLDAIPTEKSALKAWIHNNITCK